MTANNKSTQQITFGSASGFQNHLTILESDSLQGIFELKFETTFASAKNPNTRQTRAQIFLSKAELIRIGNGINTFLATSSE